MTGNHRPAVFAAVDIGASSGRVVAGLVDRGLVDRGLVDAGNGKRGIELDVVHRFPNAAARQDRHLRWDLSGLFEQVLIGLEKLSRSYPGLVSIGIDTWAVDYGLLDEHGRLLAEPVSYRDARTSGVIETVHGVVDPAALYAVTGLQFLPFNTLYQLSAERRTAGWGRARHAVLLPDLLGYWLTGQLRTEITNASTTGLLDAQQRRFAAELFQALELPLDLFPPLVEPGEVIGRLTREVSERTGLSPEVTVVAVGSHDTASAVVGVPARDSRFAYVSSGTWSLVGVELREPLLSQESRLANFTNEGGVDRRVRYLRNVGGLWLLQESLRTWRQAGDTADQDLLLKEASQLPTGGPLIDVDAAEFIPPGDMPERIRDACRNSGQAVPASPAEVVRCILDSLAVAYARTVRSAEALSGQVAAVIHIVGGGCQNALLCQLTADLAGRSVLAGPVEATALGNLAVQARTAGLLPSDLDELRRALRRGVSLTEYRPSEDGAGNEEGAATR